GPEPETVGRRGRGRPLDLRRHAPVTEQTMAKSNGQGDNDRIAALEAQVATLTSLVQDLVERNKRVEDTVGMSPEVQEQLERQRAWAQLSAADKTQLEADRRWAADAALTRDRVTLWSAPDGDEQGRKAKQAKEWPAVVIPAHSEEEAKARYQILCGIRALTVPGLHLRAEVVPEGVAATPGPRVLPPA